MQLVLSCLSDQIMRQKSLRTTGISIDTEMGLNTVGSENKNTMIQVNQKFALAVVGNKVFSQSRIIPLEMLRSEVVHVRESLKVPEH